MSQQTASFTPSTTSTSARPHRFGVTLSCRFRALRVVMAIGLLAASAVGFTSACGGDSGPPPDQCAGGVVLNGVCEGKCEPDKCLANNTCVGNRCMLTCDEHTDCYPDGSQDCQPATEDDTNASIFVCQRNSVPRGMGIKCPFKIECDGVGICPNGQGCERAQCGGQPDACVKDAKACGKDEACTLGTCPDGSACVVNPCTLAECQPLSCLSKGEGDADAYCTRQDCQSDADCAGGFYCGITRDPHELCGSDPQKGDNNFCGMTSEPCIDPSALGQGNTLFEGSRCILRKTCVKRPQCAPCTTDLDCSQFPTQRCVQVNGEGRCARSCAADSDCDPDYQCTNASCVPRFGACTGQGEFCHPCLSDEDCGGKDSTKACIGASGDERACYDSALLATPCDPAKGCVECLTDADCPASPSGRHGECFNEGEGVMQGAPEYRRCYLPFDVPEGPPFEPGTYSCW
jgi:hypothetical protein